MGSLMMKLLLLMLVICGSIPCSLGFEPLEILASQKGGIEKTGRQLSGKAANPSEDVKKNHENMIGKLKEYGENLQPAADCKLNIDGNFRCNNKFRMRRLLQTALRPSPGSVSNTGTHG
ncbi:hypothetical protein MANES_07G029501v8 [Manihot esculenta]|uniref:Uncharacterized protein n=1 Tax=Manihot esculenta TaxID=3983 RepID=A0ACB7HDV8_MANES|nr:hypothetical protein MANES_07G029501v8 [Manihot esculenta]